MEEGVAWRENQNVEQEFEGNAAGGFSMFQSRRSDGHRFSLLAVNVNLIS